MLFWDKQAGKWVQRVGLDPGFNAREAVGIQKGAGIHPPRNWGSEVRIPTWSPGPEAQTLGEWDMREETRPKSILRET